VFSSMWFEFENLMVTKSNLQSLEIHPISLLSLHCKVQLDGCSLEYTPYFSVSKLSFIHRVRPVFMADNAGVEIFFLT
jgi:hypothetical protein